MKLPKSVKPDISIAAPYIQMGLRFHQEVLAYMEDKNGWFYLPPEIAEIYKNLGIAHWAEIFDDRKKVEGVRTNLFYSHDEQLEIADRLTSATEPELCQFFNETITNFSGLLDELEKLRREEKHLDNFQKEFDQLDDAGKAEFVRSQQLAWLSSITTLLDHLSLMVHGQKLTVLVNKAINNKDDDAFVKAVQIDGTLLTNLPYFRDRYWNARVGAETDFLDTLAYRTNNPTSRGEIRYPILWILFDSLYDMNLLDSLTNVEILEIYSKTPITLEKQIITDVGYVRRQRKKFLKNKGK